MRTRLFDLWRWDRTIDRLPYGALGSLLFLAKFSIDTFAVRAMTGRPWSPVHYWIPGDLLGWRSVQGVGGEVYALLLLLALPFIWIGVVLTMRRLRAAGLPSWLVVVFFIPALNVLTFILLCLLPTRVSEQAPPKRTTFLDRMIPRGKFGGAVVAVLLTAGASALVAAAAAAGLGSYGWGLFVGIPFVLGLVASVIHGYHEERSYLGCFAVTCIALLLVASLFLMIAIEGLVCLVMAAPLAIPVAAFGAFVGYLLQKRSEPSPLGRIAPLLLFAALLPLIAAEEATEPAPPLVAVRTVVEIDAPPARVWSNVISFSELPPPDEWIFRTGLAYPIRAVIDGRGPGAVRHCVFSTGSFVEPIETWDEPRRLGFTVTSQPAPMEELTLWPGIRPPHLDGHFLSRRGQFLLEPLPGGRTRLEGTTWYEHRLWPQPYWSLWSDPIIHRIHARVLRHVKRLSEGGR